jgi:hypothetical protein
MNRNYIFMAALLGATVSTESNGAVESLVTGMKFLYDYLPYGTNPAILG